MARFDARVFMTALRLEAGETACTGFSPGHIRYLLGLAPETFLQQSYRSILARDVDLPGLNAYKARAGSRVGRLLILLALYLSPERILLPPWCRNSLKACAAILKKQ